MANREFAEIETIGTFAEKMDVAVGIVDVKNYYIETVDDIVAKRAWQDGKSRFQELAQEKKGHTPTYKTISETGPDHDKKFTVGVYIGNEESARGEGKSKQEAEQAAAQAALEKYGW